MGLGLNLNRRDRGLARRRRDSTLTERKSYARSADERPALLDRDFGVPLGLCAEAAPGSGVFSRDFTTVTVSLDCAQWAPTFAWK